MGDGLGAGISVVVVSGSPGADGHEAGTQDTLIQLHAKPAPPPSIITIQHQNTSNSFLPCHNAYKYTRLSEPNQNATESGNSVLTVLLQRSGLG